MRVARWLGCVAALGALACDSGTNSSGGGPVGPSSASGTVTVQVGPNGSMSFSPASVSINVGDTVIWQWQSTSIPHTVTSGAPGAVDGKFCSVPGGTPVNAANCNSTVYATVAPYTYSHTFSTAGSYPYFCTVHGAMMSGTITVGGGGGGGGY